MTHIWQQKIKTGALSLSVFALAAAPLGVSAVSDTANTTVEASVSEVISVASSGTVAFTMDPVAGGVVSSASDTVTVSTNNTGGYTLTVIDADTTTNLASGGNTITPTAGTTAAPATLSNGEWGFAVAGQDGFGGSYSTETNNVSSTSTWAGMPASSGTAATLKSTGTTAVAEPTTVWYAAKVDTSQPDGTYTDTVTYTATTN